MHPKIKEQMALDGYSDDVDPETFSELQRVKFLLSQPADRVAAIQNLDSLIAQPDDSTLRAKSELLNLRRKLSLTHEQMLKARR